MTRPGASWMRRAGGGWGGGERERERVWMLLVLLLVLAANSRNDVTAGEQGRRSV